MAIIVNVVKQGHRTTNDGNTSRRFFSNPKVASTCTGFNEELLSGLTTILILVNGDRRYTTENFKKFCLDTYEKKTCPIVPLVLFARWCAPTSSSFVGGLEDEHLSLLPLSFWSEEASKVCNKLWQHKLKIFSNPKVAFACTGFNDVNFKSKTFIGNTRM
eukprot:Pompholyxophrys_punicea_v1_NODE_409_length_2031_cov_8.114879.p2 type:complete len:160 gc:universal NODE_409_length_2031_cov_8.114879:1416-1895(+)